MKPKFYYRFHILSVVVFFVAFSFSTYSQTALYSYQSGDWSASSTWTTDPSGTLFVNPTALTPSAGTSVVILNGRTVMVNANTRASASLEIKEGGIVALGGTTGHNFGAVTGMGTIQMVAQTGTFGAGTSFTTFVAAGGGTFELNNSASFNLPALLNPSNNLIINNTSSNVVVTLLNNLEIRGNLIIESGTFRINDNTAATPLSVTLSGDLEVGDAGRIRTGTGNASGGHSFYIKGNFTNNGSAWFSNLSAPLYHTYPATGYVHAIFDNTTRDQHILCNDTTKFYRIEIAKGIDKTYILNIDAANSAFFRLLGNNYETPTWTDEATNDNALGLESGTCRLGNNIVIPCLTTGYYYIKDPACLWIDGAQVVFRDASYNPQPTPGVDNCGLYVYGSLKMTGAGSLVLNNFSYRGIVLRGTASVEFHDQSVFSASMIRTSANGSVNRGAFILSGNARVTFTGNTYDNRFATFDLGFPDNLIQMSGGILKVTNPTTNAGGVATGFSLRIASDERNQRITGGSVILEMPADIYLNSKAPFYDLTFTSTGVARNATVRHINADAAPEMGPKPLVVKNDLAVIGYAALIANNTNGNPVAVNVSIGGDFSIEPNGRYTPGNNTTTFDGNGGQLFSNSGTITNGLNDLVLASSSNTSISHDLAVRGSLTINAGCSLNDVGHSISVQGNIVNSGTHYSQAGGSITLNGSGQQQLGGSGEGVFGNIIQNNANGISFQSNQTIHGDLRLAVNGVFNIGVYNLAFSAASHVYSAATGMAADFSNARMITTAGNESDGGVSKVFDEDNTSFTFPFGVTGKYTPARIQVVAAPSEYGSVTTRPVNKKSPFATSANILSYYWKTRSEGFTGIAVNSVRHTYRYVSGDVVPAGTDNNYVAGVYLNSGWTSLAPDLSTVDENNDTIKFRNPVSSGMGFINGDFTAGAADAFSSIVTFYSRQSGNWNDNTTWSNDSTGGAACPAGNTPGVNIPGPSNPVIIGDGSAYNHIVTVPAAFNNISTGSLQISRGSVLDLTASTGHNFGSIPDSKVTGNGRLKISSASVLNATAEFPRGDFGLFLDSLGGAVEYYSTATLGATTLSIPAANPDGVSIRNYKDLILSPFTGKSINLPASDLLVYGDCQINGTTTGIARLSVSTTNSYRITVRNNLQVNSGVLQYPNLAGRPQHAVVTGDVIISDGASFIVNSAANSVANTLTINGNLTNNGILDLHPAANPYCNLVFTGAENKQINGTTATRTRLNAITLNKGTSRNAILDVTVNNANFSLNTSLTNALTLTNGTFRLTTNTAINLSTSFFKLPTTGCLSANGGTFNIATSNADNADLELDGRLEVLAGTINIGTAGNTNNNDIEYASAGTPEIMVRGGTLNVIGQIRRSTIIETGSLSFTQSGGTVNIYGTDAQNERSMLEVLNEGSVFRMQGGNLVLHRSFNNALFTDLYIMPDTSDVSGGTIQLGTNATPASQFNVVLASPVWNLTINGDNTAKSASLRVAPLIVLNDLIIGAPAGANSYLVTNGLDVSIGHNLYNYNTNAGTGLSTGGYQPGTATQNTTFNGNSAQLLTGRGANITNFANLILSNTGSNVVDSLASNTTVRVNSNLSLLKGILADGNNIITVTGDVINTAVHRSSGTNGIIMAGARKQFISGNGNGVFGNLTINNGNGVDMRDNSTVNGMLTLTSGLFYIDDMLLTLGPVSSIGGTPGSSNMIRLNGALSDLGVRKIYPSGASSFTFPVGVSGKYTPATLNVTANTFTGVSSITVKPINSKHPATFEITPATDELQYYWNVSATGFNNGAVVTHTYKYINSDALPNETGYVAARYHNFGWTFPAGATVNAGTDEIMLNGYNQIDGEYTCGVNSNFQDLQTFYSRSATAGLPSGANWDMATSWTLSPDGNGAPAPYAPDGNPLVILPGHRINAVSNGNKAYSILLNGTLDLAATVNHSHGHVNGNGTLRIGSTAAGYFVFPGGEYDEFMKTPGTIVEFYSTIPATLPNSIGTLYKPYQNLRFTGSGTKYMASVHMKARGWINIQNGYLSNIKANKDIYIMGDWLDAVANGFAAGKGTVYFTGASRQIISVNSEETFNNLAIDNMLGDSITGPGSNVVKVSKNLILTNGKIVTNANHLLHITNNSPYAVTGGGSSSFVSGPMRKTIETASFFDFPVGKDSRYGNVWVSDISSPGVLEAEYFNENPHNPSSKVPPIDTVTSREHWNISFPGVASGNVKIRWDEQSDIIPSTAIGRTKLRIVEWNGSAWENRGGLINGTLSSGTIRTNPAVNLNGNHYFTIGLESLPTANIVTGDDAICNDGIDAATIRVDLTGTAPWTIKYKVNGDNEQTLNNIGSSPAYVVLNSSSPGFSGPDTYIFNISYICDGTGSTGMRDFTKQINITVEESPSPSISGKDPVSQNEAAVKYSITGGTGHTYVWVVTGGTITAGQGTNEITVTWGAGVSGTVAVTETITSTGCDVAATKNITINPAPGPVITGDNSVCSGSTETYTTGASPSHRFTWTVTGGTILGGTASGIGLNSIQVKWSTGATGSVEVLEEIISPYGFGTNTMDVTINPLPDHSLTVTDPAVCAGSEASVVIEAAEAGMDYSLRRNSDNVVMDFVHTTMPGDVTLSVFPPANTVYNILVENEYGCSEVLTDLASVTLLPNVGTPVFASGASSVRCQGAGNVTYSATASNSTGIAYSLDQASLDGGNSINATTGQVTYAATWSGTTLITASADGCNGPLTAVHTLTIPALPAVPVASVTAQPTCGTPTGTITVSSPIGAAFEYNIDGGSYQSGTAFSGLAPGGHSLRSRLAAYPSCVSASGGNLTVNNVPSAPAIPTAGVTAQPTCAVPSGTITVSAPTGAEYEYNIDGGTYQSSTVFAGLATGNHRLTARLVASPSCISGSTADIVINAVPVAPSAPTAAVTAQPTCSVSTGTITVSAPLGGQYEYNIDGGNYQSGRVFAGLEPGYHQLTVRLAASTTCVSPSTPDIAINASPATPASPVIDTIIQPDCDSETGSVVLTGLPAGNWTINPGTITGNGASATIVDLSEGTYHYTVTNAAGCMSTESDDVVIRSQPLTPMAPVIDAILQPGCTDSTGTVNLSGLPESGSWTIREYPGSAVRAGSGFSFAFDSLAPGTHSFTVTGSSGCTSDTSDAALLDFPVNCELTALFAADDTVVCAGSPVLFTDLSYGTDQNTVYLWDFGEGAVADSLTGPGPHNVYYTTAGSKSVRLILNGVQTDTLVKTGYITVYESATVSLVTTDLCGFGYTEFQAFTDGTLVEFSLDSGLTIAATDTTAPYSYWVEVAETSSVKVWARAYHATTGCAGRWDVSAEAHAYNGPYPELGDDKNLCEGETILLDPEGSYVTYRWHDNSTGPTFTANTTGMVSVKVTDEHDCPGEDSVMVTINANPEVNLGADTVLCEDNALTLDAGDFEQYDWSTGENGNPVTVREGAGLVSVTVTDINGCRGSDEILIGDCSPVNMLVIPNTFTPNDDGYHDRWHIKNIQLFPDADIQVFDRWGRRVYQSDGASGQEWDGTGPNGNDLPVENYFYVIDLKVRDAQVLTGTVSIVR